MMQQHDVISEVTWRERLRQLRQLRDPLSRRIEAAHEEGDYDTRDRLWRDAETLRGGRNG